jgi:hypothetical protein
MPTASASSVISRRAGATRIDSSRCATSKKTQASAVASPEQYQLFDTPEYSYRVFVTNITGGIALLTWLYNPRAGAENLIKEAKNDAGLTAHPSGRWSMNCIYFSSPCWLTTSTAG